MHELDRRALLAVAGTLAATTAFAQNAATATKAKPARTLKKAVGIGMVDDKKGATILERFQLLRDLGFDGVELDSPSDLKPDEVLAAQTKTGLQVNGLVLSTHWGKPFNSSDPNVRKASVDALQLALKEAKQYGAISVLVVPAVVNEHNPYDLAWTLSQQEIGKCLPLAKELGVAIAIENVWNGFLQSPLEAARYVDEFNDPIVRWHFDIGNVVNYGWPEQWIRVLGRRIAKLHIKDYSRTKRDKEGLWKGFDVELGEGDANYAAVMAALDEVGYSTSPAHNWGTAEVGGGDRKRLKQVADQMDRLFKL